MSCCPGGISGNVGVGLSGTARYRGARSGGGACPGVHELDLVCRGGNFGGFCWLGVVPCTWCRFLSP